MSIVSQCCSAVDRLVTFCLNAGKQDVNTWRHLTENAELFKAMLNLLFQRVLFEGCENQWSLSRPMFVLIVLNPEVIFLRFQISNAVQYYNTLKNQLIASQPEQYKAQLVKHFEDLMSNVQSNLDHAIRDRFSQNLNTFVQAVKAYIVCV